MLRFRLIKISSCHSDCSVDYLAHSKLGNIYKFVENYIRAVIVDPTTFNGVACTAIN